MAQYARNTTVSAEQSEVDIKRTLRRYGAEQIVSGEMGNRVVFGFVVNGRMIRFDVPMPERGDKKYATTPTGKARTSRTAQESQWEKDVRQKWRALLLTIKAKLEAVESEISTFEKEFLAHVVLPDGTTVGEWIAPQLERAYAQNAMPALMSGVA